MRLTYVHLSDIHFGQETGSDVFVHEDVKQRLLEDVRALKAASRIERMDGVIVTGDIAFSGKKSEYDRAALWLDQITEVIGCEKTDVLVVPGNHDIDRTRISAGADLILQQVVEGGYKQLDRFLADPGDREVLYAKFHAYRAFAEGYACPLASDGGVAVSRKVEVAPNRLLQFVGLNSALLCTAAGGDEGKLLLGGGQHVLPMTDGEELVVLCHHPLESLQDGEVASPWIRSRARVHIFGHVHDPSVKVEAPEEEADLLTISAGAVVPPNAADGYQYTYNLLTFRWDSTKEALRVEILPRAWNEQRTIFEANTRQFGTESLGYTLRCPNFRKQGAADSVAALGRPPGVEAVPVPPADQFGETAGGIHMGTSSDLLRLHFFRDLSEEQRVQALIKVGQLPDDWALDLSHAMERRLWDKALSSGLEDELASEVDKLRRAALTAERGEDR